MSVAEAVLLWWLAFTFVSIAFAPVTWWMAAGLGTYRHALTRPVGLVVATFLLWWPAAIVGIPFQPATVFVFVVVGGVVSWISMLRIAPNVIPSRRSIAIFELVWVVGLLGYVAFRSANPDIANTEKPMEIALLSSVVLSYDVPAPDPWFAGSAINYYYFGYQSIAMLVHLSGVSVTTAFNLALGSIFASTITVASGLGSWLAERVRLSRRAVVLTGVLAAAFVGLAGNLETFVRLVRSPSETLSAGWWDGIGWQASRVIKDTGVGGNPASVDTINEFPAFSFVLGDLHPHLTTLPVLLTTLALATGLASCSRLATYQRCAAIGAFAGLLYASNSWDAPVGTVVVVAAIFAAYRKIDRKLVIRVVLVLIGAIVAALPFAISYTAPVGVGSRSIPDWLERVPVLGSLPNTIAVVTWRPSSTAELLVVHGLWIIISMLFFAWSIWTSSESLTVLRQNVGLIVPVMLVLLAGAIAWSPALILLAVPAAAALVVSVWDQRQAIRIVAGIYACGFALALVPEFLYIQDSFGSRMNTVFKLNFQAWIFLAIGSAAGVGILAGKLKGRYRPVVMALTIMSIAVSLPYAVLSADDWMEMGISSGTLDGGAYLEVTNPAESHAIKWLAANASPGDVIVEAPGCAYQTLNGVPMNRFSAFTGVPTLLGWKNHEGQWRRGEFVNLSAILGEREALANRWLDGMPSESPDQLNPRFVVFGAIERSTSERCLMLVSRGENEIETLRSHGWQVVFEEETTTVLERPTVQ